MVSRLVSAVFVCLFAAATAAGNSTCKSTFCFKFLSRKIDINFNLFNDADPVPIEEYIRLRGYPVENHVIQTEDGYLLTYHRIPHGKSASANSTPGRPVLLQHGLLASSPAWIMLNHSLGFSLADAGFDVWLGNARGNTYSRKHVKYDPDRDKEEFWDFSWHEMGYYDLPASIDYILNVTARPQLFYIGHSMGTTMYFVLGATRPEYMDKVQAALLMAPVAFPWNILSPLAKFLNSLHMVLNGLAKTFGIYEILPYSDTVFWLDQNICARKQTQFICQDLMFYIGGFDGKDLNRTSLSTVLEYMPGGASYKQLRHFRQLCNRGTKFQQFDYGYIENMWKYGSFSPPVYNLTKVKSPVYVYYGPNDWLAVPEDVYHVVELLPNVKRVTRVPNEQFNHLDFMWAIDAKTLLYDDVIATFHSLTV